RVNEALEFADVAGLRNKGINEISAGERQRVVLARALVQEPKVLLLDEATSHLDIGHQESILAILRRLNRQGVTVLFLSHDLNLAGLACSRLLLLDRGRSVVCGPPEEVVTGELIRSVYGVEVLVSAHPQTGRPQVMLPESGAMG
ncbi:MAG: ABC transporter ATP-binding protein, partial [candidate division WOR-3 bacterium]